MKLQIDREESQYHRVSWRVIESTICKLGEIDCKLDQSERTSKEDRAMVEEELRDYEHILALATLLEGILEEMARVMEIFKETDVDW